MPMQATTTTPLFAAALRPDRSARLAGGWIALVLAGLVSVPFMLAAPEFALPAGVGLAATAAGLTALQLRQSRRARVTQVVTLWPEQLEIATTDAKGGRVLQRLDPRTLRIHLSRDDNEKVTTIALRQGAESIEVGQFLSVEDKASFAKAFGTALRKARRV